MIGFLVIITAVMLFTMLGYVVLLGNFYLTMLLLTIYAFTGIAALIIASALWEFWFPRVAKTLIAHKRKASFELAVDDLGWGELTPSKTYLPEGLVKWKFGWSLLPRPIQKLGIAKKIFKRKSGRPPKDPEEAKRRQREWIAKQKQEQQLKELERDLAEQIALKKIMLKGLGKPLWLQYTGLAGNFNPQVLVASEAKQDNPRTYFQQLKLYVENLGTIPAQAKTDLAKKLEELQQRVETIRVVVDPRRFKEIHPKMYTQSQMDAHGQIHEEIGRLSVSGMPLGKILTVLLIVAGVCGALFVVYYFSLRQPMPMP